MVFASRTVIVVVAVSTVGFLAVVAFTCALPRKRLKRKHDFDGNCCFVKGRSYFPIKISVRVVEKKRLSTNKRLSFCSYWSV